MNPLLMLESVASLRRKLASPGSPLAPWWGHFLTMARKDPIFFSPWTILAAVVTGEAQDRALARQNFLRYVELGREAIEAEDAHNHTHTLAAPLGRWAIYYDWVADLGLFSADEDAAIRRTLLDHAFVFTLQQVQARSVRFDNQILSNSFACAAVGYVLGVRRGREPVAQRLLAAGAAGVEAVLQRLPEGGYSGEGSTYHEQVVLPLAMLSSLLLREITGRDVLARGVADDARPVRELLETSFHMIGPTGLLPGWDQYGFQPATIRAGLALLSRISGDATPLAVMRDLGLWPRLAHPAWEIDDRLWTLVWWPDELAAAAQDGGAPREAGVLYRPWVNATVAGALQSGVTRTRLFQCWDACGGLKESGRLQVDPNAVTLEAHGSLVLVDGYGHPPQGMISHAPERSLPYIGARAIETVKEYVRGAWAVELTDERAAAMCLDGSVGLSNAIVLDGEDWYVPRRTVHGRALGLHQAGPLQALRSDAASFYVDRYDVTRVTRASLLVDGGYAMICDRVTSRTPHAATWQAFVRRPARAQGDRVVIETPEGVRCDLIPLQPGAIETLEMEEYPRTTRGSVRVRQTAGPATTHRIEVALMPQSRKGETVDLSAGWERSIGEHRDVVDMTTAPLSEPMVDCDRPRVFTKRVSVAVGDGRRRFLEVARATPGLELRVNGQPVAPREIPGRGTWEASACGLPWVFDITDALRDGENELRLAAPVFHGESVEGPVRLSVAVEPAAVRVEPESAAGGGAWRVRIGNRVDHVLMDHEGPARAWAGGVTDARFAVLTRAKGDDANEADPASGVEVALAEATTLSLPEKGLVASGLSLSSHGPCDLAWTPAQTLITRTSGLGTVSLAWKGGRLEVELGGCVQVTYCGSRAHRLALTLDRARPVFVNGELLTTQAGAMERSIDLPARGEAAAADVSAGKGKGARSGPTTPASVAEVLRLAQTHGAGAGEALVRALKQGDWRVQTAAADALGRLGYRAAVEALLEFFAAEEQERVYPKLRRHWSWSKMLPIGLPGGPDPELPRPIGEKRWRVKRAVVTALGRLGDARAVAPLEAAMVRCDDFFTVTSQLALALGRLGSPTSLPILERNLDHAEVNTKDHARLSAALLRGEIGRSEFEASAGPG